ncbi:hypothetical protein GJ744_003059 [Endocarpon pusillum]|uniref:Nucleolar complex protein 14 n=1 Tax=Endocarpon pusillum TaxID=364733 RepID=A0A8H7DZK0_9EURO|nr:hypothetical protein GJ744_003059 [Endocarpon pusillum]
MPPSQLKQLKASLRDQGLVGPQKSKKQKKLAAKDAGNRQKRSAALHSIREHFNPFEVKTSARKEKFEVVSLKDGRTAKSVQGRPGVTKGLGEERRRATLLKEIQSRNKVGQIVDRRFGENDPTMTPEQRAAERFARQSERHLKKNSIFNLEDEADENTQLTHMGRFLTFGEAETKDDFKEGGLSLSDGGSHGHMERSDLEDDLERPTKRRRLSEDEERDVGGDSEDNNGLQLPEKKKSKQEVMKEVIAKSKLYKYERQQAKEDDDDLRAELDKGLPDFLESIRNYRKPSPPPSAIDRSAATINPDRAALLAGRSREEVDHEYNERVRQMAMDKRSKPSTRTKTDEEKAEEEAARLRDLEEKRLLRMQGAPESSDDENGQDVEIPEHVEEDDAEAFGLGQSNRPKENLDVEGEDEFVLDDDLVASDSEADLATEDEVFEEEEPLQLEDDGDDDFINGLVLPPDATSHETRTSNDESKDNSHHRNLSFTYPCPTTHEEFLKILQGTDVTDVPTIVQRIRAFYHPKLNAGNREKLEAFSAVLTQHVAYLADHEPDAPLPVLQSLLRHLHSLAKSHPPAVATAFRAHLRDIADHRPLNLRAMDFIILTGISTIFPTSDHFHSVVTPAGLTIARFLGQSPAVTLAHLVKGAYCCTLALQCQSLSQRYIPEVMVYIQKALSSLGTAGSTGAASIIRSRLPEMSPLQLLDAEAEPFASLRFQDLYAKPPPSTTDNISDNDTPETTVTNNKLKATLISHFLTLLNHAADLWRLKSAFPEIFKPATLLLQAILSQSDSNLHPTLLTHLQTTLQTLTALTTSSLHTRLPLALHFHRPLAIKSSIPKFEESYNPDHHHDPDRERSQLNKLKAEHKREKKGALRELRKDANFIAREQLREKKERDAAYEKKFRRLVAEIQSGEGHEGKVFEREKARRRGRKG